MTLTCASFIESQLQLEQDARETLPYVSLHNTNLLTLLINRIENRQLHENYRQTTPGSLLLLDLQSSSHKSNRCIQSGWSVLLMLHPMPR